MNGDDFTLGWIVGAIIAALLALWFVPDSRVHPREYEWAAKVCEPNGGLWFMRASGPYRTAAFCRDGTKATANVSFNEVEQ